DHGQHREDHRPDEDGEERFLDAFVGKYAGEVVPADGDGIARAEFVVAPAAVGIHRLIETDIVVRTVLHAALVVGQRAVIRQSIKRLRAGELAQRAHGYFAVIGQHGGELGQRLTILGNDTQVRTFTFRQGRSLF